MHNFFLPEFPVHWQDFLPVPKMSNVEFLLIKPQPKLTYNYSSHELFNRNLLSVNNSYFDKYKEVKKQADFKANIKNENNYLEPLLSIDIRKQQDIQNQKKIILIV